MHTIYVGDAKDVVKRIRSQHCGGNVEGSALRKHVAQCKGYSLKIAQRSGGSRRVRIDLPKPDAGEKSISDYIRAGSWQIALCSNYDEAHDFQWYLIQPESWVEKSASSINLCQYQQIKRNLSPSQPGIQPANKEALSVHWPIMLLMIGNADDVVISTQDSGLFSKLTRC